MADSRLLKRFQRGDPDAVRTLYERYGRAVFVVALKSLGDRSLAEEAVQLTFLKAWRAAARFDVEKDPAPWLYAIARRTAVDVYRSERRHSTVSGEEAEIAALSPSFEGLWQAWAIREAIDQLPADEKVVIEATHFRDLTMRETAEELGIPVGTVKSRSFRAHRKLAGMLEHLREASA